MGQNCRRILKHYINEGNTLSEEEEVLDRVCIIHYCEVKIMK